MKRSLTILLIVTIICLSTLTADAAVRVRGYYRRNGTYVQSHYRSNPDGNFYNNWSTYPNVNPYTGSVGTRITPSYPSSSYSVQTLPYYRSQSYSYWGRYEYLSKIYEVVRADLWGSQPLAFTITHILRRVARKEPNLLNQTRCPGVNHGCATYPPVRPYMLFPICMP